VDLAVRHLALCDSLLELGQHREGVFEDHAASAVGVGDEFVPCVDARLTQQRDRQGRAAFAVHGDPVAGAEAIDTHVSHCTPEVG
jgi:hypothetical protein